MSQPVPAKAVKQHGLTLRASKHRRVTRTARAVAGPQFAGAFERREGPVLTDNPTLYAIFVGDQWTTDAAHQQRETDLVRFLEDLVSSSFLQPLAQYGCGKATFGKALSYDGPLDKPLKDSTIGHVIESLVAAKQLPRPSAQSMLVLFLDDSLKFNDPDGPTGPIKLCGGAGLNDGGYHYYLRTKHGGTSYYAVVPSLSDACLGVGGPPINTIRLDQTQLQRQTIAASHEITEMLTDPEPWSGWTWQSDGLSREVADLCENADPATLQVEGRSWLVTQIYSLQMDTDTGGVSCCAGVAAAHAHAPVVQAVRQ